MATYFDPREQQRRLVNPMKAFPIGNKRLLTPRQCRDEDAARAAQLEMMAKVDLCSRGEHFYLVARILMQFTDGCAGDCMKLAEDIQLHYDDDGRKCPHTFGCSNVWCDGECCNNRLAPQGYAIRYSRQYFIRSFNISNGAYVTGRHHLWVIPGFSYPGGEAIHLEYLWALDRQMMTAAPEATEKFLDGMIGRLTAHYEAIANTRRVMIVSQHAFQSIGLPARLLGCGSGDLVDVCVQTDLSALLGPKWDELGLEAQSVVSPKKPRVDPPAKRPKVDQPRRYGEYRCEFVLRRGPRKGLVCGKSVRKFGIPLLCGGCRFKVEGKKGKGGAPVAEPVPPRPPPVVHHAPLVVLAQPPVDKCDFCDQPMHLSAEEAQTAADFDDQCCMCCCGVCGQRKKAVEVVCCDGDNG